MLPSGGPLCPETLWEPRPLLEWQERKLQLCLQSRPHRQRLRQRSVTISPRSVIPKITIKKKQGSHCSQICCLRLVSMCCGWRRAKWSCAGISPSLPRAWSACSPCPTLLWATATPEQTTWTGSGPPMFYETWSPVCCTTSPPSPSNWKPTATTRASPPRHWFAPVSTWFFLI